MRWAVLGCVLALAGCAEKPERTQARIACRSGLTQECATAKARASVAESSDDGMGSAGPLLDVAGTALSFRPF